MRLQGYDYAGQGAYFITLCAQDHRCLFGIVAKGEMALNEAGLMLEAQWLGLTDRFPQVELDVFVVMPDHMHGILLLNEDENSSRRRRGESRICPLLRPEEYEKPEGEERPGE